MTLATQGDKVSETSHLSVGTSSVQRQTKASLAMMLGPALLLLGVFILVPLVLTIWLSFQDWSSETGFDTAKFIGLDNFFEIFGLAQHYPTLRDWIAADFHEWWSAEAVAHNGARIVSAANPRGSL